MAFILLVYESRYSLCVCLSAQRGCWHVLHMYVYGGQEHSEPCCIGYFSVVVTEHNGRVYLSYGFRGLEEKHFKHHPKLPMMLRKDQHGAAASAMGYHGTILTSRLGL